MLLNHKIYMDMAAHQICVHASITYGHFLMLFIKKKYTMPFNIPFHILYYAT